MGKRCPGTTRLIPKLPIPPQSPGLELTLDPVLVRVGRLEERILRRPESFGLAVALAEVCDVAGAGRLQLGEVALTLAFG